jgi:signal peptidase I
MLLKPTTQKEAIRDSLGEIYQEACSRGVNLKFKIISGSMTPLLEIGDEVEVTWTDVQQIRIGDIVAFRQGSDIIVHRITGKSTSTNGITFKNCGDANWISTEFDDSKLVGRVIARKRGDTTISLVTFWYRIAGLLLASRTFAKDSIIRIQPRLLRNCIRCVFKPVWIVLRFILLGKPGKSS